MHPLRMEQLERRALLSIDPAVDLNGPDLAGIDHTVEFVLGDAVLVAGTESTVSDADSTELASLTVTITNLKDGDAESLSATVTHPDIDVSYDSATGVLSLTGQDTLAHYQEVLRGIVYNNTAADPDTTDRTIEFVASDGDGQSATATCTLSFHLNQAPVNQVPGALSTLENTPGYFVAGSAVSVSDADAGDHPVRVTLTATNGTLTLSGTEGLEFTVGDGTADDTMTFTGTTAAVNLAMTGLEFMPTSDYLGSASVRIVTSDQGHSGAGGEQTDDDTVAISVVHQNVAPENEVPNAQSIAIDEEIVFSEANGNRISISDVDAGENPVRVTLVATHGTLTLGGVAGLAFTAGDGTADGTMTFTGTIDAINTALGGMRFVPEADYAGLASLQIVTSDQGYGGNGGEQTDDDTLAIRIGMNDPPVNHVPGAQSTEEDVELVFSEANDNRITISDPDAGSAEVQVTLAATHGTLTLSGIAGLTFAEDAGDGTADATMTFTGTIDAINAALNGLKFLPEADYVGTAAAIEIVTDDLGHSGSGDPQTDIDEVAITVTAVNDAPTNQVPASLTVAEDTTLTMSGSSILSVSDVDVGNNEIEVTLTVTQGTLTLRGTDGLTFTAGDGTGDATMTFTGKVSDVNYALDSMEYDPPAGFYGSATLTITTDDQGGSGSGGQQSDTDTVTITVTSVNDAPVLHASGDASLTGITDNQTTNSGNTVAEIIDSVLPTDMITDADADAVEGIAIIAVNTGTVARGKWQFSIDGGSTWTDITGVSDTTALLLRAEDRVRFLPSGGGSGTPSISFRAWDQTGYTSGLQGTKVSTQTDSMASPFSQETESATIAITSVNHAPVLNNSGSPSLNAIDQNPTSTSNTGTLVSALIASVGTSLDMITDGDSNAKEGIAVTSVDNTYGKWQYSTDGTNFVDFTATTGSVVQFGSSARLLASDSTTRIRFVPNADFNGTVDAGITFRAWDQTSGANGSTADVSTNGGTTAFSTAAETASIVVGNASIAGRSFVDANNNGAFDTGETPLAFVRVKLSGSATNGQTVSQTTLTDANGEFRFDNLPAGTYSITQEQPAGYADGQDWRDVGTTRVAATTNDTFSGIAATANQELSGYCFAELGLTPQFLSKRLLLSTAPAAGTTAYNNRVLQIRVRAEEIAGNTDLAEEIRQVVVAATDAALSGSDTISDELLAAIAASEDDETED